MALDRLNTWSRYDKSMCQQCEALCCHLPVEVDAQDLLLMGLIDEFEISLGERYILKKFQGNEIKRWDAKSNKFILSQKADGSCLFLDSERRCTIYEKRPQTCRNHPKIGPRPGFCPYQKKSKK